MIICTNCGYESPETANFCPKCGTKLEHKAFCANCGEELIPGMPFCPACGTKAGTAPKDVKEVVPPSIPVKTDTQKIYDVCEFEEVQAISDTVEFEGYPSADGTPAIHIQWASCVFGDAGITNNGESLSLDLFKDHFSFTTKFSFNAAAVGGWLGMAISAAKKKGNGSLDIPYQQIAEITFGKPKHDTAKRMNVTLRDGSQLHFFVAPMNKLAGGADHLNTEQLFQKMRSLAAPYMN